VNVTKHAEGHIVLTFGCGTQVLVDADIWEQQLSAYRWCLLKSRGGKYIYVQCKLGTMHRMVLGAKRRQVADYINRNTLDNRRANLRIVTPGQNRANSGATRAVISGFKGVSWSDTSRKWIALVTAKGKRYYLGLFEHKERAAMAVDRAALKLHGAYAALNFEELRTTYRPHRGALIPQPGKKRISLDVNDY